MSNTFTHRFYSLVSWNEEDSGMSSETPNFLLFFSPPQFWVKSRSVSPSRFPQTLERVMRVRHLRVFITVCHVVSRHVTLNTLSASQWCRWRWSSPMWRITQMKFHYGRFNHRTTWRSGTPRTSWVCYSSRSVITSGVIDTDTLQEWAVGRSSWFWERVPFLFTLRVTV